MDSVDYIGVAVFRVVGMRELELLVSIEVPMRAGVRHDGVAAGVFVCKSVSGRGSQVAVAIRQQHRSQARVLCIFTTRSTPRFALIGG